MRWNDVRLIMIVLCSVVACGHQTSDPQQVRPRSRTPDRQQVELDVDAIMSGMEGVHDERTLKQMAPR
jgi:hypothetical protein